MDDKRICKDTILVVDTGAVDPEDDGRGDVDGDGKDALGHVLVDARLAVRARDGDLERSPHSVHRHVRHRVRRRHVLLRIWCTHSRPQCLVIQHCFCVDGQLVRVGLFVCNTQMGLVRGGENKTNRSRNKRGGCRC